MQATPWVRGPVGVGARQWLTRYGCKSVLVAMPTMTAGTRLLDVLPVFDGDHRVQVVVTVPSSSDTWHGLHRFAQETGALVLPWEQAARAEWDTILCASTECMEQMHGRILLLPHGASLGKSRERTRVEGPAPLPTTGLDREALTRRGRVVPSAIAVPTDAEREMVRERCPEAYERAIVCGDPCLDLLVESLPKRATYRREWGVAGQLVTISSTWSSESTFGSVPQLYERAVAELAPARVAAVLHPNIWAAHGAWQIQTWLAPAVAGGLLVIPPERGWQAAVVASDIVLGDHGSTTAYAAAIGVRTALVAFPDNNVRTESPADVLARSAPRIDLRTCLRPQVDAIRSNAAPVAAAISSRPGESHSLLRRTVYRLLGLSEPDWPAAVPSAQLPQSNRW